MIIGLYVKSYIIDIYLNIYKKKKEKWKKMTTNGKIKNTICYVVHMNMTSLHVRQLSSIQTMSHHTTA